MKHLDIGDHLIEVKFAFDCDRSLLERVLSQVGFEDVRLDITVGELTNAGEPILFVAKSTRQALLEDTDKVVWSLVHRFSIEPFADLAYKFTRYLLLETTEYEVRFISYVKAQKNKDSVLEHLGIMGWDTKTAKICQLHRNMRVPGRPGAEVTLWCGVLCWGGPHSLVTEVDPFLFEDCLERKITAPVGAEETLANGHSGTGRWDGHVSQMESNAEAVQPLPGTGS